MAVSLVILAAGVGRRYGGLKQMEPVGPAGETLMEYSIYDAGRSGFDRVVLLDAMQCEDGCCSLRWLQADDLQLAYGYSTHGFGVAEALKLGEKLGLLPEQWYLMGIGMEAEVDARTVACAARMIFDLPPFRPGPGETARDPAA